jgi:hypothetical protein
VAAQHTVSLAEAKTRESSERADNLALKNAELRRELVSVGELASLLESFMSAARERIWGSSLLEEERRKLLGDLQGLLQGLANPTAPKKNGKATTIV